MRILLGIVVVCLTSLSTLPNIFPEQWGRMLRFWQRIYCLLLFSFSFFIQNLPSAQTYKTFGCPPSLLLIRVSDKVAANMWWVILGADLFSRYLSAVVGFFFFGFFWVYTCHCIFWSLLAQLLLMLYRLPVGKKDILSSKDLKKKKKLVLHCKSFSSVKLPTEQQSQIGRAKNWSKASVDSLWLCGL